MIGKALILLSVLSFINVSSTVATLEPMPTMCCHRYGTCTLDSNGDITCTKIFNVELKGFTYPKTTHPTGDKFIGVVCDSMRDDMCALTASGKFRCYWNGSGMPGYHPNYDDGWQSSKTGKYVFINMSPHGSLHTMAAIKDDGSVETWGEWKGRMTYMPGKGTLYKEGGKWIFPNPGNTIVNIGSPGNFGAYLESNGTITSCRNNQPWADNQAIRLGVKHNVASFMKSSGMWAAVKSDGTIGIVSVSNGKAKIKTAKSGQFVRGGCNGGGFICQLTSLGKVECFNEAITSPGLAWVPEEWGPTTGKFVACACGYDHTCCAKEDGTIECVGPNEKKNLAATYTAPVGATPVCSVDIRTPIVDACLCAGEANVCAANKFCYDGGCKDTAKHPDCPVNFHTALAAECFCGTSATTSCAVGQWCYENICKTTSKCGVRADVHKNLFYGAKVYGSWNATSKRMYMNFTTPWDVTVNKIKWRSAADNSLLYLKASHGFWKIDDQTDPCKPTYELDVPQKKFFGTGSNFTITGSQLSTSLIVEAKEDISVVKNRQTYTYKRKIKNIVPVLVNLITKTTIAVRFRSTAAPPGPGPAPSLEDFVLFIGAEDNFSDPANANVVITMQVHSRTCVDHAAPDGGVRVKTGADNIKVGSTQLFNWKKDSAGNIIAPYTHNLCVEELEWTFVPKQYKEDTYEIELEFDLKNLPQKFTTIAAIDIKQADVLADIGFTSSIATYNDSNCTSASDKFILGHKFYTKIELTDMIIDAENITCNTYKIKQTKAGNIIETDLKAEVKYAFMQKSPMVINAGKEVKDINKHICGAELESHHFHVSVDGYDTILETEILIEYNQANTRRYLLQIPLSEASRFDDEIMESSYMKEIGLGASGATYSDEDKQFREAKREPDQDNMVCPMFIETESDKAVGAALDSDSTNLVLTMSLCILIVGAMGFAFGFAQSKGKQYQAIPDKTSSLLVELE